MQKQKRVNKVKGIKPPLSAKEKELKELYDELREKKVQKRLLKEDKKALTKGLDSKKIVSVSVGLASKSTEKDTGFKRPAKLQRKLDEMKESQPSVGEDIGSQAFKRRKVDREGVRREEFHRDSEDKEDPNFISPFSRQSFVASDEAGFQSSLAERDFYPATIFVGNLEEGTTEQMLEPLFSRFGQVECIRLISGKNFAFVKYITREAAFAAIAGMNGELVGQQHIRVSRAKVQAGRGWGRRRHSWDSHHSFPRDEGDSVAVRGAEKEVDRENMSFSSGERDTSRGSSSSEHRAHSSTTEDIMSRERTVTVYDDL